MAEIVILVRKVADLISHCAAHSPMTQLLMLSWLGVNDGAEELSFEVLSMGDSLRPWATIFVVHSAQSLRFPWVAWEVVSCMIKLTDLIRNIA